MSVKRGLLLVLVTVATVVAVAVVSRVAPTALALPSEANPPSAGTKVPYPGHLATPDGQSVADGAYDFRFALYDSQSEGTLLWSEEQTGVAVKEGDFAAILGSVHPIPTADLNGGQRWLAVEVRGPGDGQFTALNPRQALEPTSPPSGVGPQASSSCVHTHFGEYWTGTHSDYGLLVVNNGTGDGIRGTTSSEDLSDASVRGNNYGSGNGVYGSSINGNGVRGWGGAAGAFGGYFVNDYNGTALIAYGGGWGKDKATVRAHNLTAPSMHGMGAWISNNSDYHTAHFYNANVGGVLYLQNSGDADGNGGGDFITAVNGAQNDAQFVVKSSGEAFSDVGFNTPAMDFAEMLPAVDGLEAGDVLAIGPDGKLSRSSERYQATVAGVYSTQPGFVGGREVEGAASGTIPLAVVGVVPVKVSAENGPIVPGDLLVASSTAGHAMKAGPSAPQGTIIGKALGKLEAGTGVVKMLVTLR